MSMFRPCTVFDPQFQSKSTNIFNNLSFVIDKEEKKEFKTDEEAKQELKLAAMDQLSSKVSGIVQKIVGYYGSLLALIPPNFVFHKEIETASVRIATTLAESLGPKVSQWWFNEGNRITS